MDRDRIREAVRNASCELARLKRQPESAELSALIIDSLDRMRMIVAIETALGVTIDDEKIMTLDISNEDNLVRQLRTMIGGAVTTL